MDWKRMGKRVLVVLFLVLLGLEVCMELRYSCDEISITSKDTEKILRQTPEVSITEEDRAMLAELLAVPSVRELLEGGENGDVRAWEEPGAAEAAGKYLDAESVESLTVSALFDEGGSVVFAGWREEEGIFYLQEGPGEGAYYKLYSPKRGKTYENWDNERAQRSEVHRRWFAWLRDGLWKDEG
jgi:hypothetical protein